MEVDKAVLLGHSWGAHLALQVALASPERVRAVVAVEGLGPTGDGGSAAFGAGLRRRLGPDRVQRLDEIDRRPPGHGLTDSEALEYLACCGPPISPNPARLPQCRPTCACRPGVPWRPSRSVLRELGGGSFALRLQRLDLPVVTVIGGSSPMPAGVAEE